MACNKIQDTSNGMWLASAVPLTYSRDESSAYCFSDEEIAAILDYLNGGTPGTSRFIGHRPPKPPGH